MLQWGRRTQFPQARKEDWHCHWLCFEQQEGTPKVRLVDNALHSLRKPQDWVEIPAGKVQVWSALGSLCFPVKFTLRPRWVAEQPFHCPEQRCKRTCFPLDLRLNKSFGVWFPPPPDFCEPPPTSGHKTSQNQSHLPPLTSKQQGRTWLLKPISCSIFNFVYSTHICAERKLHQNLCFVANGQLFKMASNIQTDNTCSTGLTTLQCRKHTRQAILSD